MRSSLFADPVPWAADGYWVQHLGCNSAAECSGKNCGEVLLVGLRKDERARSFSRPLKPSVFSVSDQKEAYAIRPYGFFGPFCELPQAFLGKEELPSAWAQLAAKKVLA